MLSEIKTGTYTGTGAAQSITLGFKPSFVFAFNQTDGDTVGGYIEGMTADTAFAIAAATAAVTSQGVTTSATGFSLGTNASLNESGKVYLYVAAGNAGLTSAGA